MPQSKAEINKRYWEKLKADPVRYKAFNERNTARQTRYLKENIKKDPVKYENHLQKKRDYNKEYIKTENGKKIGKINGWKYQGVIDHDFDLLYDYLISQTNCMVCDIKFKNSLDRQLDHDHNTGEPRYICCCKCNNMLSSIYE